MTRPDDGLTVLWRGSLESCNYGCPYCPFAKTTDDRDALAADRAALERFAFLVMRAGLGLLRTEIVDYARSIIDCVVQLERRDGRRCISHIEVCDSARWRLTA